MQSSSHSVQSSLARILLLLVVQIHRSSFVFVGAICVASSSAGLTVGSLVCRIEDPSDGSSSLDRSPILLCRSAVGLAVENIPGRLGLV